MFSCAFLAAQFLSTPLHAQSSGVARKGKAKGQRRSRTQDESSIQVELREVSGRSLYFDKGREEGIAEGTRIRLLPTGQAPFTVLVTSSTRTSARAILPHGRKAPPLKTRGLVLLDSETRVSEAKAKRRRKEKRSIPEHPPWSVKLEEQGKEVPLLAPAFGETRSQRKTSLHGRAHTQIDHWRDRGGVRRNSFTLARLGVDLEVENPFGRGGRLEFDGDVDKRAQDLFAQDDRSESRGRIDRLSYEYGLSGADPFHVQAGRYYSEQLPEVGLLDGVEAFRRMGNGYRAGGGFGLAPLPVPSRRSGEDVEAHLFFGHRALENSAGDWVVAYQKTWHKGDEDRDLLIGRYEAQLLESLYFYSSLLVDVYDGSDSIKGRGLEITQFWAQTFYTAPDGYGGTFSVSHYAWPELLRDEIQGSAADLIRDGKIDRVDLSGWFDAAEDLRINARFGYWADQQSNGTDFELGADVSEFLSPRNFLSIRGSYTDAAYSAGPGLHIRFSRNFDLCYASLSYDYRRYRVRGFASETERAERHLYRAEADFSLSRGVDLGTYLERSAGDRDDSISMGLFLQYRF